MKIFLNGIQMSFTTAHAKFMELSDNDYDAWRSMMGTHTPESDCDCEIILLICDPVEDAKIAVARAEVAELLARPVGME